MQVTLESLCDLKRLKKELFTRIIFTACNRTSLGKTTYRNVGPEPENTRVKKCLNVSEEQQPECHRSHPSFLRHKPGGGLVLVLTPGICHWFTDRKVKVEVQYYQNITPVPLKSGCQLSVSSHGADLSTQVSK